MMVIFLTGLVAMILLRTLRNDYAKYTRDDDDIESLEHDISEESGWKLVHGDVFRPPPNLALLAALLGTGVQLALLILSVILITIAGRPISAVHHRVPCTSVQQIEWPCYGQDQQSTVAVMFASETDWAVACCVYFLFALECMHSPVLSQCTIVLALRLHWLEFYMSGLAAAAAAHSDSMTGEYACMMLCMMLQVPCLRREEQS